MYTYNVSTSHQQECIQMDSSNLSILVYGLCVRVVYTHKIHHDECWMFHVKHSQPHNDNVIYSIVWHFIEHL